MMTTIAPLSPLDPRVLADGAREVRASGEHVADARTQAASALAGELTREEQKVVQELKKTDAEVRAHERAHQTAGGPVTGGVSYEYTRGPDGKMYAVGGEVSIDASPEADPAATIQKMDMVIRAALAPADPSIQDRRVAAQARQEQQEAVAELRQERLEEQQAAEGNAPPGEAARASDAYAQASALTPTAAANEASPSQLPLAFSA